MSYEELTKEWVADWQAIVNCYSFFKYHDYVIYGQFKFRKSWFTLLELLKPITRRCWTRLFRFIVIPPIHPSITHIILSFKIVSFLPFYCIPNNQTAYERRNKYEVKAT